jgi:hypothetical protein
MASAAASRLKPIPQRAEREVQVCRRGEILNNAPKTCEQIVNAINKKVEKEKILAARVLFSKDICLTIDAPGTKAKLKRGGK